MDGAISCAWNSKPPPTRLVIARNHSDRDANRVVFLGRDSRLYSWNPAGSCTPEERERSDFLTGPLAVGDLNGDGRDEMLVLCGPSSVRANLGIAGAGGSARLLDVRPSGSSPEKAVPGVTLRKPTPEKAVQIE